MFMRRTYYMDKKREVAIRLKRFNMDWIGENKVLVYIGKRGTGKTYLVLDYLYHHQDIPIATCICPTNDLNGAYTPHIPGIFIHDKYTPDLVEKFVKRQRRIGKLVKSDPNYRNVDSRAMIILDDCLYNAKNWIYDENISWIFMNGRHAKITLILTMQYALGITPNLRTNVDYVFICREPRLNIQKKLYEHYCGIFPSFEMFRQVLDQCTKDYGCMVIDNNSISDRIEDQVFIYKAPIHSEEFRLCYDRFWINNEVASEDEELPENPDYNAYSTRQSKIKYNLVDG